LLDRNKLASFRRNVDGLHAFTAPAGNAVVVHRRPFPVPVLGNNQQVSVFPGYTNHPNHLVVRRIQRYAAYASRGTAHGPNLRLVEMYGFTLAFRYNYMVITICQ